MDMDTGIVLEDKPKEAIDMYTHQQDWNNALRVAETSEPAAVPDVLVAQASSDRSVTVILSLTLTVTRSTVEESKRPRGREQDDPGQREARPGRMGLDDLRAAYDFAHSAFG